MERQKTGDGALEESQKGRSVPFLVIAMMIFLLTVSALTSIGLVPSYIDGISPARDAAVADELAALAQGTPATSTAPRPYVAPITESLFLEPQRISIDAIDVDLPINNPEETSVQALDASLLSGTVRYPGSALLNEKGNVFIFGHSSGLPVVKNPMFKAFNRLQELKREDLIEISGGGETHVYRVKSVRRTDVDEALVDLSKGGDRRLTLSTCDSFGGKSSRFVVEAEFFASYKDGESATETSAVSDE